MTRKLLSITVLALGFFILEFSLFNAFGSGIMPDFLLLLLVYINQSLGIRYCLFTALVAGVLKDSFHTSFFGFHIFTYILLAYTMTVLSRFLFHRGSWFSRLIFVGVICCINLLIQYLLLWGDHSIAVTIRHVVLPEIFLTLLVTNIVFSFLRQCALKYFAS